MSRKITPLFKFQQQNKTIQDILKLNIKKKPQQQQQQLTRTNKKTKC